MIYKMKNSVQVSGDEVRRQPRKYNKMTRRLKE